jgi:hypothetical protein
VRVIGWMVASSSSWGSWCTQRLMTGPMRWCDTKWPTMHTQGKLLYFYYLYMKQHTHISLVSKSGLYCHDFTNLSTILDLQSHRFFFQNKNRFQSHFDLDNLFGFQSHFNHINLFRFQSYFHLTNLFRVSRANLMQSGSDFFGVIVSSLSN